MNGGTQTILRKASAGLRPQPGCGGVVRAMGPGEGVARRMWGRGLGGRGERGGVAWRGWLAGRGLRSEPRTGAGAALCLRLGKRSGG